MPDLPHVTAMLAAAGLVDTTWFTDYHRDRGTAVHEACHYLVEGDLDWTSLDPAVEPRVQAFARFLDEMTPEVLGAEVEVVHEVHHYQGRVDLHLRINDREGVLDIKPPTRAPWHRLQVMLYSLALSDVPMPRWNLHLRDDSTYRLVEHAAPGTAEYRRDRAAALAVVTLTHWRNACQQQH